MTAETRRYQALAAEARRLGGVERSPVGLLLEAMVAADDDPSPELCVMDLISRGTDTGILAGEDATYGDGTARRALAAAYDRLAER